MKLYMTTIDDKEKFLPDDDLEFINFNYFHGTIDEPPLGDFVYCEKGALSEIENKGDFIEAVTIVKPDGTEIHGWYYHWKTLVRYKWVDLITNNYPRPCNISTSKGLVVAMDDEEGNKYAFEQFNNRAEHL